MPSSPSPAPGAGAPAVAPHEAFAELGRAVLGEQPLGQVLTRVAELARACIPGADQVSVTLIEDGSPRTAASTGAVATALDERQYSSGSGPCLEAARTGAAVVVPDTAADVEHPGYASLAQHHGVTSSLSVGMPVPRRVVGALNTYRTGGAPFDEHAEDLARVFAGYAAVALANSSLYSGTAELAQQMQHAMASRASIEQAKGILMGRLRISADEALTELSRTSQRSNRKLRDVAADVVAEATGSG